jgi:RimJ/RimL family protein N-acetyltransferase
MNRASAGEVGLRLEGWLRENEHFKGRCWDTMLYGLLQSEWRTLSPNS